MREGVQVAEEPRIETLLLGCSRWHRAFLATMAGQPLYSWKAALAQWPLWSVSQLYGGLLLLRCYGYQYGIRQVKRLPCRVLSIGNLTVGGTGKTPLTIWVARWCQQQGWPVAVLSRGYGGRLVGRFCVVSYGDGPCTPWHVVGDEPYMLARALPGIPVLVGRDRYLSGRYACDYFGSRLLILDDGFQYWRLWRDLDIVLVDASNPFGPQALLPRGILREPLRALRRAHAIVLTRMDMARMPGTALVQQIRYWTRECPVYMATTVAEALYTGETPLPGSLDRLRHRRVVALAGIGNPQAFAVTLRQLGCDVQALLVFPDHHPYTAADWQRIVDIVQQRGAECLVTTEKDAVRLAPQWHAPFPVYTLRVGMQLVQGEPELQQQLRQLMRDACV